MPSFTRCFTLLAFALLTVAHTEPAARSNRHRDVGILLVPVAREAGLGESPLPKRRLPSTSETSKRSTKGKSSRRRCKTKPTNTTFQSSKSKSTSSAKVAQPTPQKSGTSTTTSSNPSSAGGGGDSGEPSYMTGTQTGDGTFYATGLGACGITNKDTDHIAAVSHLLFDTYPGYKGGNPNNNPVCGKQVTATYKGNSVTVTITDRCVGCAITDLDFAPSAFDILADEALGRIHPVTWVWV